MNSSSLGNGSPKEFLKREITPEWDKEPNRAEFKHAGFDCLINRNQLGAWCGYVAVTKGHPWFERHYNDVDANVHGGLTYSEHCQGGVCHVPAPGAEDDVWWLGFDCCHCFDVTPALVRLKMSVGPRETYKNIYFALQETKRLAEQARFAFGFSA